MSKAAIMPGTLPEPFIPAMYPGTTQSPITTSASSQQSAAVGASTTVVMLVATTASIFAFGTNPDVTSGGAYLPANVAMLFAINPGDKIAVKQAASTGTFYITEGA